jgi:very-short-patch-repair endonuclease
VDPRFILVANKRRCPPISGENRFFMESINIEGLISIRDSLDRIAEEIKQDRNDLYQMLLEICEEINNLFSDNDDYSWPMSIDNVCKIFDFNRNTLNSHKNKYLQKGKDYFTEGSGRTRTLHFEQIGVIKILMHYRTEKGTRFLNKYGIVRFPKEEHLYINTINCAVSGLDICKKEYKVKDYKIDLYLTNRKLAIECDEHDHYWQEYSVELFKRQEDIIKELGCRFLRFNPYEIDFNVGEVINVIYHHISNKLINGKDPIDYYMEKRERTIRKRTRLTEEELAELE